MPRLFVLSGDDLGRTYDFDGPVVLGRGETADVRLRSVAVSRAHARLEPTAGGGWRVVDLGSRNGVLVDDERVPEAQLSDGAVFKLGELELRLRLESAPGTVSSDPLAFAPESPLASPVAPRSIEPPAFAELPVDRSAGAELDGGLELEGDWEEVVPPPSRPVRPAASAPPVADTPRRGGAHGGARGGARGGDASAASAAQKGGAAASDRDTRRAELMRRAGIAPPPQRGPTVGKPVLQYHREAGGGGLMGSDLAQAPAWQRVLVGLVALAALAGLVYGALTLTRSLRKGSAPPVDPTEAEDTTFFGGR